MAHTSVSLVRLLAWVGTAFTRALGKGRKEERMKAGGKKRKQRGNREEGKEEGRKEMKEGREGRGREEGSKLFQVFGIYKVLGSTPAPET